jgi:hypothetical protein
LYAITGAYVAMHSQCTGTSRMYRRLMKSWRGVNGRRKARRSVAGG